MPKEHDPPKRIILQVDWTASPPKPQPWKSAYAPTIYTPVCWPAELLRAVRELREPSRPTNKAAHIIDPSLAHKLSAFCKQFSQEQVADKLGYDVRTIRRWITNGVFSKNGHAAVTKLLDL